MSENYDIYNYKEEELEQLERSLSKREFSGVWCPKKNNKGNGKCAACSDVHKIWQMHNETGLSQSKFSEKAKRYGASPQYYMNVVLAEDPNKVVILQCGKKMAMALLNGVKYQGWKDIWHPIHGSTIIVHKSKDKDGWPSYTPSPDMDNVKRKLSDLSVLEKLHNLDDIEKIRAKGTATIYDIKSMEKVLKFDILPGWDRDHTNTFYKEVFYHYNVDDSVIEDGIDDPILTGGVDSQEAEGGDYTTKSQVESPPQQKSVETQVQQKSNAIVHTLDNPPGCFGMYFDPNDKEKDGCNSENCSLIRVACEEKFKTKRSTSKVS